MVHVVHFDTSGRSNAIANGSGDHSAPERKNNAICGGTTRITYLTSARAKPIEYISDRLTSA